MENSARAFWDDPFLWGGVGVIAGAVGSVLDIKWFFLFGWLVITIALCRADWPFVKSPVARWAGKATASLALAAILFVGRHRLPKPPESPTQQGIYEAVAKGVASRLPDVSQSNQTSEISRGQLTTKAAVEQAVRDAVSQIKINPYSNVANERLLDESGYISKVLHSDAEGWKRAKYDWDGATRELIGQPRADGPGHTRSANGAEKAEIQSTRRKHQPEIDSDQRTHLRPMILEFCDLREELLNRLRGVSVDSENDALFAKLKTTTYDPEDLSRATVDLDKLREAFASSRNLKLGDRL